MRLGRPLHLLGGVGLHGLGVLFALTQGGSFSWPALLWGQLAISATQWVTHFSNEYFDLEADRAHTATTRPRWSGGSGVLPEGEIPPVWALRAAWVAVAVALVSDLVLATEIRPGATTWVLLLGALAMAWSYSGPPAFLHRRGVGEPVGALLVAGLTPLVGFHLQGGSGLAVATAAVAPLLCLQLAMLITVSLPDREGDAAAGKGTWAVLFGPVAAERIAAASIALALMLPPVLATLGVLPWPMAAAALLWTPFAMRQALWLLQSAGRDPQRWDRVGFWAIGLVIGPALTMNLVLAWILFA
jgi:1,4-dihydroxy-2-naphthoate octaprenyltransferase